MSNPTPTLPTLAGANAVASGVNVVLRSAIASDAAGFTAAAASAHRAARRGASLRARSASGVSRAAIRYDVARQGGLRAGRALARAPPRRRGAPRARAFP